jgi:hypothetical protein
MLPELDQRSFKNALASALGIALALLAAGRPARLIHGEHINIVMYSYELIMYLLDTVVFQVRL